MNEDIVEYKEIPLIQCPFCGSNDIVSQRGNQQRMCMGCGAEGPEAKSRQGADALWNRRTPEPGTSVLRWTRYDGTPETLPESGREILCYDGNGRYLGNYIRGEEMFLCVNIDRVFWAYLPKPPEGMA